MESGLLIDGRYRLIEPLGRGGMSVVWRADDEVLGREVAVKVLAPRLAADPAVLRRIRDEARAAAGLRHPHVVEVHDYGEWNRHDRTVPYVVMELLEGRSAHDLLSGGALAWRLAVLVGAQVAAALAAAHARGVVHRDVKPANVMVTASGAKLVDFGISASVGEWENPDDEVLGTPAYLAPERIGGGPAQPATDVYALGLFLYLALAGRMPWEASTTTEMLSAHRYAEPARMPPVAGLPRAVTRLVHRCLAKRPEDRPTAAEVADRLGEIAGLKPNPLLRSAAAPAPAPAAVVTAPLRPPARAWGCRPGDSRTVGDQAGDSYAVTRPAAGRRSAAGSDGASVSAHRPDGHRGPAHGPDSHNGPAHGPDSHNGPAAGSGGGRLPGRRLGHDLTAGRIPGRRLVVASLAAVTLAAGGVTAWAASGTGGPTPAGAQAAAAGPGGSGGTGCSGGATAPAAPDFAPCRPGISAVDRAAVPSAAAQQTAAAKAAADRAAANRAAANRAAARRAAADKIAADRAAANRAAARRAAARRAAADRAAAALAAADRAAQRVAVDKMAEKRAEEARKARGKAAKEEDDD